METIKDAVSSALANLLPASAARSIVATLPPAASERVGTLDLATTQRLLGQIATGLRTFGGHADPTALATMRRRITGGSKPTPTEIAIAVSSDTHVLDCQRRCQDMVRDFFSATDCVRLTTAVSELARNIYMYAGHGEIRLRLTEGQEGFEFRVIATDHGPGIANLEAVLRGRFVSKTGLGRGLAGTRALLDEMDVKTELGRGTVVTGTKKARRR